MGVALAMAVVFSACQRGQEAGRESLPAQTLSDTPAETLAETLAATPSEPYRVGMVTDTGGVNDHSFNQSAWEGLQRFARQTGSDVFYLESTNVEDYMPNLTKMVTNGRQLIWGMGYGMGEAILTAAATHQDLHFAIMDYAYEDTPANVTGVMFRAQEPSFVVGYIAGLSTQTGKVGFIGGVSGSIMDQLSYGYQAGVAYAARELGRDIEVEVAFTETYTDEGKGKSMGMGLYGKGCDIIFQAAGGAGVGVIAAAQEAGRWVIGVDRDQSDLAPDHVLTSALKKVDVAVELVSTAACNGEDIGGQTYNYGMTEDAVGIPEDNPHLDAAVYEKAMLLMEKIKTAEVIPPGSQEAYQKFLASSN